MILKRCIKNSMCPPGITREELAVLYSKLAEISRNSRAHEAFMIEIRCLEATFSCKSSDLSDWYQDYWIGSGSNQFVGYKLHNSA